MRRYRPNKRGIEDRKLDKLTDEERRIRFIRTAELYRDQYLKLLHPKRNKSLRAKYMKLIDQIQDGGDEMRRHFQWTMRTLDQYQRRIARS